LRNAIFVTLLVGGLLGVFFAFQYVYAPILRFCLAHKASSWPFPACW
jgi:hypothetical protein